MRTEDLKNSILKMFGHKKFYGYEVHKKLASENMKIEISRLYRVLNEMMKEKLLDGGWERSPVGPRKKVYSLGSKGKEKLDVMLLEAIGTIHSFYGKYLTGLPSEVNPLSRMCSLLTEKLKGQANIAYVAPKHSGMHERMIRELQIRVPQGTIHLIRPSSIQVDLNLDGLLLLKGSHDNIPMKDNYFDLLLVVGLPERERMQAMLQESHRVSKKNGTLAILAPHVLTHKSKDPLTIGDYIERIEHQATERSRMTYDEILRRLSSFFKEVEQRNVVHVGLFLATKPRART